MKPKVDNNQRNMQGDTPENISRTGKDNGVKSKLLPNEVKQNHRTGHANSSTPVTLKEFLSNKLPRKAVSDSLLSSIKEKIKAFHLL